MSTILKAAVLALALMCSGCVSVGTNFNPAAVDQLQPGMTKAEVISRLGQPNGQSTMADGREVLVWLFSEGNALGQGRSRTVTIIFDQNGRMTNQVTRSQAQVN